MRHPHYNHLGEPWMIAVYVAAFIIVLILLIWLIHRTRLASDGLRSRERETLPPEERQLLSMLRQDGGPKLQTEIADLMPYELEDIASMLKNLESQGLIHREWKQDQGTYEITAAS